MEFCVISPTAGLERYATLSKYQFVLAHEYQGAYAEFYVNRKKSGDFVILDNGTYENGTPMFSPEIVEELVPDVVVLPDYLLQPWEKTWHAAMHFLNTHFDHFPQVKWMYVPQAEEGDYEGFIRSYEEIKDDPRITWLGIPRCLTYAVTHDPLARVLFARHVRADTPRFNIHCLGMCDGDIGELPYLAQAGVTSIDSSAPVWRGWNGLHIQSRSWRELGTPVDFNSPIPNSDMLVKLNLEVCGVKPWR